MYVPFLTNDVWWSWNPADRSILSCCYHWFNVAEGSIWFVFVGLVYRRYLNRRRFWLEAVYSELFLTFGVTDICEPWQLSTWLICLKLINLLLS